MWNSHVIDAWWVAFMVSYFRFSFSGFSIWFYIACGVVNFHFIFHYVHCMLDYFVWCFAVTWKFKGCMNDRKMYPFLKREYMFVHSLNCICTKNFMRHICICRCVFSSSVVVVDQINVSKYIISSPSFIIRVVKLNSSSISCIRNI